tara:strand:+ start:179 stop:364 length:186 start_codon:yes stop_codon:yes gene_type:complete
MESIKENVEGVKVEVSLELIKSLRNVIEVANGRITWKLEELLPIGVLVRQLDEIIKENKEN